MSALTDALWASTIVPRFQPCTNCTMSRYAMPRDCKDCTMPAHLADRGADVREIVAAGDLRAR
jgi:hypothetical protein